MKLLVVCLVALTGLLAAGATDEFLVRQPRHLKQKLCGLLGLCSGGFGGGYGGYQGNHGYQGYHQGYQQPPINIGISQSQTSSSGGGGYYGGSYPSNPNYYQYNGNFGHYPRPYPGPGYGYNQFNGNFNGGPNFGGRPVFYDEETGEHIKPIHEDVNENYYGRSAKKDSY